MHPASQEYLEGVIQHSNVLVMFLYEMIVLISIMQAVLPPICISERFSAVGMSLIFFEVPAGGVCSDSMGSTAFELDVDGKVWC